MKRHIPGGQRHLGRTQRERGAVAIIVAVFAIGMLILLAFVVDQGRVFAQRSQLQNAVDAAALAAVPETCGNPIATAATVRAVAVDYADQNDITVNPADVIVQDGPNDFTTGVSVAAEQTVSQFFGGFAGITEATVAARGTATRPCVAPYRMVAKTLVGFSGGGSVSGRIYAGECFRATGNGGTYDAVAVSIPYSDTTTCAPPNGSRGIEPGNNTVVEALYEIPAPTLSYAYSQTPIGQTPGYTEAELNAKLLGPQNCGNFAAEIICAGNVNVPNNATITVNIITTQPVEIPNNSRFAGALIYTTSNSFAPSNEAISVKAGGDPASVYYAPFGKVQANGSANPTENAGIVIADTIDFNGGSQDATGGVYLRSPGPWRLSQ